VYAARLIVYNLPFYANGLSAVGKTLAYTSIKFMNAKDELVARGSHTKSVIITHQYTLLTDHGT